MDCGKQTCDSSLILLPTNILNSTSRIIQTGLHGNYIECMKEGINKFSFLKCGGTFELSTFLQCGEVEEIFDSEELLFELFMFSVSCLQAFIQQNWTGPLLCPPILETVWKNQMQQIHLFAELEKDGEVVNENTVDIFLLAISLKIFAKISEHVNLSVTMWWNLRCLSIHQQLLSDRSPSLKLSCEKCIQKLFAKSDRETIEDSLKVQLNLEAGLISLFYYKYEAAIKYFVKATKLSGIHCSLSGRMGVRTRFQTQPTSQLCLQVKKLNEINSLVNTDPNVPKALLLNNETLLETVKFTENGEDVPDLCPEQLSVLLAYSIHMTKARATQQLDKEEIKTVLEVVLSQPKCWAIQCEALKCRSMLEDDRTKTVERSMMQVEELVSIACEKVGQSLDFKTMRLNLIHSVRLEPIWELRKRLAKLFASLGAHKSALEIYLNLKMWDEAIVALIITGRGDEAKNIINKQLRIKETPTLWCLLGDILTDKQYYEKAWEVSNHRSARAMRCLGAFYISKKNYQDAVRCFEESLNVNELQVGVCFSLGCAYMVLEDYKGAVKAFQRCTSLNWDNFEAWTNLSASFIRCGEKNKAFKTLQDALRCNFNQWQIWDNYLSVCIDTGHFKESISAYNRLLTLKDKFMDLKVLSILANVVVQEIPDNNGEVDQKLKPQILELFGNVTSKTPNNWRLWVLYAFLNGNGVDDRKDTVTNSKSLSYLQKAIKYATHTGWERNPSHVKEVYDIVNNLHQSIVFSIEHKTMEIETLKPILASTRLQVNSMLSTLRKHERQLINPNASAEMNTFIDKFNSNIVLPIVDLFNSNNQSEQYSPF